MELQAALHRQLPRLERARRYCSMGMDDELTQVLAIVDEDVNLIGERPRHADLELALKDEGAAALNRERG